MGPDGGAEHFERLAFISNEYATIALDLDTRDANGPPSPRARCDQAESHDR